MHLVHKYPPTPQLIDCIMFNSDLDEGRPLRKGRVLDLSQVEIWDGQPGETGSHLLRTMKPDGYFVGSAERSGQRGDHDFDKAPPDIPGTYVGHIRTAQDTSYYIFLWPDHGVKPLDISFYRNNRIYYPVVCPQQSARDGGDRAVRRLGVAAVGQLVCH